MGKKPQHVHTAEQTASDQSIKVASPIASWLQARQQAEKHNGREDGDAQGARRVSTARVRVWADVKNKCSYV